MMMDYNQLSFEDNNKGKACVVDYETITTAGSNKCGRLTTTNQVATKKVPKHISAFVSAEFNSIHTDQQKI